MRIRLEIAAPALLLGLTSCGGGGGGSGAAAVPRAVAASPVPVPSASPATSAAFDVRAYGARCDGTSDDAAAIQRAEQAAAKAATAARPAVVTLPAGTCALGGPVAWDSNVDLTGAGMSATTLLALASFTAPAASVRSGVDGKQLGMIWLDGPTATSPIENVTIENLGFDPRAGTQNWADTAGVRAFEPISCYMRAVHHLTVQHVAFELGANPSTAFTATGTEGPKAFVGVSLPHLGVDPLDSSHDLTFNDVHTHNGIGTLRLALVGATKNGVTSSFYNLTVTNEYDTIDLNDLEDDRIEIDGITAPFTAPLTGAPLGQMWNLAFSNLNVSVAPAVNIGSVNVLRLNASTNTAIRTVRIDGITYTGSPNGYVTSTVPPMHDGTGSVVSMNANDIQGYLNDILVANVVATNTIGLNVTLGAPAGEALAADVRNVVIHDAFIYGGLGFTFTTPKPSVRRPNSQYDITVENVHVDGSPSNALNPTATPIGVEFYDHVAAAGDGAVLLQNVSSTGFANSLEIQRGFDGMVLDDVHWDGAATIQSSIVSTNSGPLDPSPSPSASP